MKTVETIQEINSKHRELGEQERKIGRNILATYAKHDLENIELERAITLKIIERDTEQNFEKRKAVMEEINKLKNELSVKRQYQRLEILELQKIEKEIKVKMYSL